MLHIFGYPIGQKGYKLYDIETEKFFISRDVKFLETIFPFSNIQTLSNQEPVLPNFSFHITDDMPLK